MPELSKKDYRNIRIALIERKVSIEDENKKLGDNKLNKEWKAINNAVIEGIKETLDKVWDK